MSQELIANLSGSTVDECESGSGVDTDTPLPFEIPTDFRPYRLHQVTDEISYGYNWFLYPLFKSMTDAVDNVDMETLDNLKFAFWTVGFNPELNKTVELTGYINGSKVNVNLRDVEVLSQSSLIAQAVFNCRSMYRKKISDGYRTDNQASFNEKWLSPMLSQQYNSKSIVSWPVSAQTKVDGIRCMISRIENNVVAFTRKHHPIMFIDHIIDEATHIINCLPPRSVIDGELYIVGRARIDIKAQVVAVSVDNKSIFKRPEHVEELKYYMFDVRLPNTLPPQDLVMEARYARLVNACMMCVDNGVQFNHCVILDNFICHNETELMNLYNEHMKYGHEGIMVKQMANGDFVKTSKQYIRSLYKGGSHCVNIMKMKRYEETEVMIHEVVEASKGAARTKGCAMIITYDFDPQRRIPVRIRPSADVETQKLWFKHPEMIVGRIITVKYTELDRNSGIPQHCTMVDFRDDGN